MSFNLSGKIVFLSGPMTGLPNWNSAAFNDAERWCREHGAVYVYNPACDIPSEDRLADDHAGYMSQTLHELTKWEPLLIDGAITRKPFYNLVVMLDGWKNSIGATSECAVATACGIDIAELRRTGSGTSLELQKGPGA